MISSTEFRYAIIFKGATIRGKLNYFPHAQAMYGIAVYEQTLKL